MASAGLGERGSARPLQECQGENRDTDTDWCLILDVKWEGMKAKGLGLKV